MSPADITRFPLLVPPRSERQRIAEVIGVLDDRFRSAARLEMVLGEAVVAEYGQAILNRAKDDVVSLVDAVSLIKGGAYTKEAEGTGRMVMRIKELNSGPRQIIVSPLGSHPTNGIAGT